MGKHVDQPCGPVSEAKNQPQPLAYKIANFVKHGNRVGHNKICFFVESGVRLWLVRLSGDEKTRSRELVVDLGVAFFAPRKKM